MNFLKKIIAAVVGFFKSGKAEAAFNKALELIPQALPIVQKIAALTPTRVDDEIVSAFAYYAVPFQSSYLALPREKRGYLLLQLATDVLAKEAPGVATNILNTAIQMAVTGAKAN